MQTKPKPTYEIETAQPDNYPVFRVIRVKGRRSSEIATYTDQNSALLVRDALNTAADFED